MYRGLPPRGQLLPLSKDDQMSLLKTKTAKIKLSAIKWSFLNDLKSCRAKIEAYIEVTNSSENFPKTRKETYSDVEGLLLGDSWHFEQDNVLEIEECNLPKLNFKLESWRKKTVCILFANKKHANHKFPNYFPLYPLPAQAEVKTFGLDNPNEGKPKF